MSPGNGAGDRPLVGDGGMGWRLLAMEDRTGPPILRCLDAPDSVLAIHREHAEAGADFLTTNTFGASPLSLERQGLAGKAAEINRMAVNVCRNAAGPDRLVFGSMGPIGEMLRPFGPISKSAARNSFSAQAEALLASDVDGMIVETMMDLREAVVAVEAIRHLSDSVRLVATMTMNRTPSGPRSPFGDTPADIIFVLSGAGADFVGANCVDGPGVGFEMASAFLAATSLPLAIQPNAGKPKAGPDGIVYEEVGQAWVKPIREMIAAGVSLIGGCCGTGADEIRVIRQETDSVRRAA